MALSLFHPAVRDWFSASFEGPTAAQTKGWAPIAAASRRCSWPRPAAARRWPRSCGASNRLMFEPEPRAEARAAGSSTSRRSRRSPSTSSATCARPIAGIAQAAARRGEAARVPSIAGPHRRHAAERARPLRPRAGRHPHHDAGVAVPAAHLERPRGVPQPSRPLIIDEIHALVPTKRGAHLALSLERLEALAEGPLQRIGLSATQRPLDEVARFLGGRAAVATRRPAG